MNQKQQVITNATKIKNFSQYSCKKDIKSFIHSLLIKCFKMVAGSNFNLENGFHVIICYIFSFYRPNHK